MPALIMVNFIVILTSYLSMEAYYCGFGNFDYIFIFMLNFVLYL